MDEILQVFELLLSAFVVGASMMYIIMLRIADRQSVRETNTRAQLMARKQEEIARLRAEIDLLRTPFRAPEQEPRPRSPTSWIRSDAEEGQA